MSLTLARPEATSIIGNRFLEAEWSEQGLTVQEVGTGRLLFANGACWAAEHEGEGFELFSHPALKVTAGEHWVEFVACSGSLEIRLTCILEERVLRIGAELTNTGKTAVRLGDISLLHFTKGARGQTHLLANPCDVFSLGATTGDTEEIWSKAKGNKRVFGMRLDETEAWYRTDNIMAVRPLAPGALTSHAVLSYDRISEVAAGFSIDLEQGVAAARAAFRGATLPGGRSRSLPTLTIDGFSPVEAALAAAADRVAELYRPRIAASVPAGWCSWYYYYAHVTEGDILDNLRYLAANRERFPYQFVQIDDGYQLHWGDWLLPGTKFPHDMAWLAREIKALGFKPGIWVAPLIMTAQSHLYREHPEWALRHLDTGELQTMQGWSPADENPWIILDGSNPLFLAHIHQMFSVMAHEWGYDYFKLDATAFAAAAGLRHDPMLTGMQSVRLVIEAIREAIGPDKYILGCGVPFGAAIGLVDGARVSDDVSTAFRPEEGFCPISVSMPQSIHRSFIHGKWWHNDPDCVLVRSQGTPHNEHLSHDGMTLEEARLFTTIVGLTQGIQMVGENMLLLEEQRLFLLDAVQPMMPAPAQPFDLFSPQPERLVTKTPFGTIIGLLNWSAGPRNVAVSLKDAGLVGADSCEVYELWTDRRVGTLRQGHLEIEVPTQGSRVLLLRRSESRPMFLGFDRHISCGASLLFEETWDPVASTLEVSIDANRAGSVSFYLPEGWESESALLSPARADRRSRAPVGKGRSTIKLQFVQQAT